MIPAAEPTTIAYLPPCGLQLLDDLLRVHFLGALDHQRVPIVPTLTITALLASDLIGDVEAQVVLW